MSPEQLEAAETTLRRGTWAITAGAVLFSVLTVTPLVERVTPEDWQWTAPILPIVVDTAVVIVVRLDSTVSRLGGSTGGWPAVLRWMTGLFTLLLNVGDSALKGDLVGVAVHAVAPLLLIVTAEAGLAYRRKIAVQLERLERSRQQEEERSRQEAEARRERERAEREREQARREQQEREAREHAAALEREAREYEAQQRREEREYAAALERERAEREERLRREEQERADRERAEQLERERRERERADRERREREAAERAAHEQREQQAREARERAAAARREQSTPRAVNGGERPALTAVPVNEDRSKMVEPAAREHVRVGERAGKSVRQLAEETGWSVGWVSARIREQREQSSAAIVPAAAGADR
ncbi:DUF2637 domain-containing protein [Streptomyces africanus]|uniref:DUF2637 domain-containing protein n=1 Tax=Streptomyces africanus TaxID=231024 RepID=UPI000A36435E|nr:DUF2637 domain-containing protein [Streptomyces africanus]